MAEIIVSGTKLEIPGGTDRKINTCRWPSAPAGRIEDLFAEFHDDGIEPLKPGVLPLLRLDATVVLAATSGLWIVAMAVLVSGLTMGRWATIMAVMAGTTFVSLMAQGRFQARMVSPVGSGAKSTVRAVSSGLLAVVALVAVVPWLHIPPFDIIIALAGFVGLGALAGQLTGLLAVRFLWKKGHLRSSVIILGTDAMALELGVELSLRPEYGVDVVGFIASDNHGSTIHPATGHDAGHLDQIGQIDLLSSEGVEVAAGPSIIPVFKADVDLDQMVGVTGADRFIVASVDPNSRPAIRVARWATGHGMAVFVLPALRELGLGMNAMWSDRARGYPLVCLQPSSHPRLALRVKRLIDLVGSAIALLVASPILAAAAVVVAVSSPGPVFFGQERIGQGGKRIFVYKFRTMTESDASDTEWDSRARITTTGAWLRRLNVDELPQLWSILKGDMSLVGPRPERPNFVDRFSAEHIDYADRHRMPVGLTGLAQVSGLRGDTSIAERVKYDNLYIDQWSLTGDFQIIVQTVIAILFQNKQERQILELEAALEASSGR